MVQLTNEEIESMIGAYKSEQPPIQINITKDGNKILGQVVGQPAFQLLPKDKDTLVQPQFGVKIIFDRKENKMTLHQNGHTLILKKLCCSCCNTNKKAGNVSLKSCLFESPQFSHQCLFLFETHWDKDNFTVILFFE
jgi:hypothetical protein